MFFHHLYRYLVLGFTWCLLATATHAELLTFSFSDPVGDATGIGPDLIRFSGIIDNETGGFEFRLEATAERPFMDGPDANTVVAPGLLNADIISTEIPHPGYYNSSWRPSTSPTVWTISFAGTPSSGFKLWQAGDRLAVTDVLGPPPNRPSRPNFFQVLVRAPDRSIIGLDILNDDSIVILQSVPEPTAFSLLGILSLSAVAYARRRRRP